MVFMALILGLGLLSCILLGLGRGLGSRITGGSPEG